MTRLRRVVAVNVPHHLTQRGNARQYILNRDEDRAVYLKLLRENIQAYKVSRLGYCLMSNHVHLIAVPELADGLALAFRNAHGRYAAYWNAIHGASGHAWQGRFYSCPLDEVHLWAALRYTELNPVRAGLVSEPESWPWSSAAVHCGKTEVLPWLADSLWRNRWTVPAWREYLALGVTALGVTDGHDPTRMLFEALDGRRLSELNAAIFVEQGPQPCDCWYAKTLLSSRA
jgi:putative transposase